MGLIKEFREFAIKGNMIDMAVGIIIGSAFNGVVDVLVKQVIMPPLTFLTEGVRLSDRKYILREAISGGEGVEPISEVAIGYGAMLEVLIDFLIIGGTVFFIIKLMNRFRKKAEDPTVKTVSPPKDVELLENLNTLMKEQNEILRKK